MDNETFTQLRARCLRETKIAIKQSVNNDDLIIQVVSHIEESDKMLNQLITRLREWYELYNPEFSRSVKSNQKFAEIVSNKNKEDLLDEIGLKAEDSMGAELKAKDVALVIELARLANSFVQEQERQKVYLENLLKEHCPNATTVLGVMLAGKIIRHSGSLRKLALSPATAIQIMGAEKALFKHIKTKSRCPKYGLIFAHPLISKVARKNQGKIAREIADKASMAFKIDFFKGEFRGELLKSEMDKRARTLI